MSVTALLESVRKQLAGAADPQFREALLWFFKETVDPYGVRSPRIQKVVQAAYPELKCWTVKDRNRFMEGLWRSGKLEEGIVAAHLYRRFKKQCGVPEFRIFERWIDRYVRNWANCDGVAGWLLAACVENEPGLVEDLKPWTASQNRWKRRACIVALLQEAKKGRNTEAILEIAARLIDDSDDMVRKGLGWVLKEAYPKKPFEVVEFLREHTGAPRLVVRIAAEKMSPRDRELLGHRPGGRRDSPQSRGERRCGAET